MNIMKKPNRDSYTKSKYGRFWCDKCDRDLVTVGGKCDTCGARNFSPRRKKQ